MLLDTNLLRRQRQRRHISRRALADTLGVAQTVIVRLEDGTNHEELPLQLVVRLADALATDISDLLLQPDADVDTDEDDSAEPDDAATVGALLAEADVLVPVGMLADALGWTLERTHNALEQLTARAPQVGLQVHQLSGKRRFVPDTAADPDQVERLIRLYDARHGSMTSSAAKTFKKVVDGCDHRQLLSNSDKVNVGRLRNAGYLTRDATPELTDDVQFSLRPRAPERS